MNPQILFITGTVVQSDGGALPMGVTIERSCGGRVKREASVDSNGFFSFQVGGINSNSGVLPEAADDSFGGIDMFGGRNSQRLASPGGTDSMATTNLIGCELRARLGGYQSSTIILDSVYSAGAVDVGTIVLHPSAKVQGTTVSATSLAAPKTARKAFEHAAAALQKSDLETAEKNLRTAVDAYPSYAEAWFRLGQVYQQQKRNPDARAAYTSAIAADKKYVNPYIRLAQLAGMEQNWAEVADITDRALAMDPVDFPDGYFFNAMAYYALNKLDIAEKSARKAQLLDSRHRLPQTHLVLADILQQKKDITGTIEQLQNYLRFVPNSPLAEQIRTRMGDLEKSIESNPERAAKSPDNKN